MKRTSKLIVLLAAVGMLVGCNTKGGGKSSAKPEPSDVANDINVAYVKSYVSDKRAQEMKEGYIASLKESGVTVDESKINFFTTENSTVAAYTDEILLHNEEYPTNQVDAILGANGFTNAEEESREKFLAKYVSDEVNYAYGTHSNASNNTNRKFWYDKEKAENQFVKGLQKYLQDKWSEYIPPEPEQTGKLTIMAYSVFVSESRFNEIKTGFNTYLQNNHITINNLELVHEKETTSIGDFMVKVAEYDEAHPNAKVDALLGLKSNSAITAAGFVNDGTDYNYGDKEGDDSGNATRKLWYKELTTEVTALQSYLRAEWTPAPEPDPDPDPQPNAYVVGLYNKFITTNLEALKTGVQTALTAAGINEISFKELGTGGVADAFANVAEGTKILLGFNGDANPAVMGPAGYAKYDEDSYNYGTDLNRKLWILEAERESVGVEAVHTYLKQNWVEKSYFAIGSMNSFDTTNTDYPFVKVDANTYSLANFEVEANTAFRVYCPETNEFFRNETTPADCGYTIGDAPDYNIIVTEKGKYNVTFYVSIEGNNHVSLEKQTVSYFYVGLYQRYINSTIMAAFKEDIEDALKAAGVENVQFTELGGSGVNVATAFGNRVIGTTILLGFNGDSNSVMGNAGYAKYSDTSYNYGTDANRKLWIMESARTSAEVVAVYNLLEASYKTAQA